MTEGVGGLHYHQMHIPRAGAQHRSAPGPVHADAAQTEGSRRGGEEARAAPLLKHLRRQSRWGGRCLGGLAPG